MKAVFRADGGGAKTGLGHLSRCIAIAEALKKYGVSSAFACKEYPPGIHFIQKYGYEVYPIPRDADQQTDFEETEKIIFDADLVVVDSHSIPTSYFEKLQATGKYIAAIDDEMQRMLPVDAVIGNAYATKEKYAASIRSDTLLLTGPQFLPLRPLFQKLPPHSISESLQHVLVTMGGEDPTNIALETLQALRGYPNPLTIHLLLGPAFQEERTLHHAISTLPHEIHILKNVTDMLTIYRQIDVAITAAGVTLWELMATGVPLIVIPIAENQRHVAHYVQMQHLGIVLGTPDILNLSELPSALEALEKNEVRSFVSRQGQNSVDGQGAARIASAVVLGLKQKKAEQQIQFREANSDPDSSDSKMIWEWRNDPLTRQMSRNQDFIPWESHKEWYKNSKNALLIAMHESQPIGVMRFDSIDPTTAEININLAPTQRGHGLGTQVLLAASRHAFLHMSLNEIVAQIKAENAASKKAFEAAGFHLKNKDSQLLTYSLLREGLDEAIDNC